MRVRGGDRGGGGGLRMKSLSGWGGGSGFEMRVLLLLPA